MAYWALIPVKRFDAGKSRLRSVFTRHELFLLNLSLFQSTFLKIKECGQFEQILVVSRDEEALEWTQTHGGESLLEEGEESLNSAVRQGLTWVGLHHSGPVLILPTDLPLCIEEDLGLLCKYLPEHPGVLIVPDAVQLGTNALFLTRSNVLVPQFGLHSFQAHCRQAEQLHLHQTIYLNRHIQQDIDTPEDLTLIQQSLLFKSLIVN